MINRVSFGSVYLKVRLDSVQNSMGTFLLNPTAIPEVSISTEGPFAGESCVNTLLGNNEQAFEFIN